VDFTSGEAPGTRSKRRTPKSQTSTSTTAQRGRRKKTASKEPDSRRSGAAPRRNRSSWGTEMKPVHRRAAHPAHHRRQSLNPSEVGNGGNQQRQEGGGAGGGYKDGGNGARKFPTSRASPPVPSRRTQNRPRELEYDLALEKRNRRAFPGKQERERLFACCRPSWERGSEYQTRAGLGIFLHHIKRAPVYPDERGEAGRQK
jgi:hypothetical protein